MFLDQNQINIWKNELNTYNIQRTKTPWDNFKPNKIITLKDVKSKEIEYNPILQIYASPDRVCLVSFTSLIMKGRRIK